jgi:hypothetical protein
VGVDLTTAETARTRFAEALAAGRGDRDYAVVVETIRR